MKETVTTTRYDGLALLLIRHDALDDRDESVHRIMRLASITTPPNFASGMSGRGAQGADCYDTVAVTSTTPMTSSASSLSCNEQQGAQTRTIHKSMF